jgi:hypothetical protein
LSSRDLALSLGAAAERRVSRTVAQLQERNAHLALHDEADGAAHKHYAGVVVETAYFDANLLAEFGDDMVELIDGDPVRARLVSPVVNDARRMIQTNFNRRLSR